MEGRHATCCGVSAYRSGARFVQALVLIGAVATILIAFKPADAQAAVVFLDGYNRVYTQADWGRHDEFSAFAGYRYHANTGAIIDGPWIYIKDRTGGALHAGTGCYQGVEAFGEFDRSKVACPANITGIVFNLLDGNDRAFVTSGSRFGLYPNVKIVSDGGTGNDVLSGGVSQNYFYGGDGDDIINGNPPFCCWSTYNRVEAGPGNDNVNTTGASGGGEIYGHLGNDYINAGNGGETIIGDTGADTIYSNGGNDRVEGWNDNDVMDGGSGNDSLDGGGQNDNIRGGSENDSISGNYGFDSLYGDGGNDSIDGGNEDDGIRGGDGDDHVNAGQGNDNVVGENGNDTLGGGEGNDRIEGWDGNDNTDGYYGNDDIYGGNGNDTLNGSFGVDDIFGDAGNDSVLGGPDRDDLRGDAGDDYLDGDAGDDNVYGKDGNDYIRSGPWNETTTDRLQGDAGNDVLIANEGKNALYGGTGEDQMSGAGGDDTIYSHSTPATNGTKDGSSDLVDCQHGDDRFMGDKVDRFFGCDRDDATPGSTPVIFVHGYDAYWFFGGGASADCSGWNSTINAIRNNHSGRGQYETIGYYAGDKNCAAQVSGYGSHTKGYGRTTGLNGTGNHVRSGSTYGHDRGTPIEHIAYHLGQYVNSKYTSKGIPVDLVGYSMGGLVIRRMVAEGGRSADFPRLLVEDAVTVGTPNGGVDIPGASAGLNPVCPLINGSLIEQCKEMKKGSVFMQWMAANAPNPQGSAGTAWTAVAATTDAIVPWDSAINGRGALPNDPGRITFTPQHRLLYNPQANYGHSISWPFGDDGDAYNLGGWYADDQFSFYSMATLPHARRAVDNALNFSTW